MHIFSKNIYVRWWKCSERKKIKPGIKLRSMCDWGWSIAAILNGCLVFSVIETSEQTPEEGGKTSRPLGD